MRLKLSIYLMAFLVPISGFGQAKHRILDERGTGVESVNVFVCSLRDSSIISAMTTDSLGYYVLNAKEDSVLLVAHCFGYEEYIKPMCLRNLGDVTIKRIPMFLEASTVKTDAPMNISDGRSVTVTVEGTSLAQIRKAEEIFPYLPFVSSAGGKLSVLGKGSPDIFINGRKMRNEQALKRLSGDDIHSMRVIISPGSEYSGSTGAVIDIRTRRKEGDGLSGNVMGEAFLFDGLISENGYSNLNFRRGNYDIFGALNFRDTRINSDVTRKSSLEDECHVQQTRESLQRTDWLGFDGTLGFDYDDGGKLTFGGEYDYMHTPRFLDRITSDETLTVGSGAESSMCSYSQNHRRMTTHNLGGYLGFNLSPTTRVDLDGFYASSRDTTRQDVTQGESGNIQTGALYDYTLAAGKVKIGHAFGWGAVFYGGEVTRTSYDTDFNVISQGEYFLRSAESSRKESIAAAFSGMNFSLKKTAVSIELRYEYNSQKGSLAGDVSEIRFYDSRFLPSISLSRLFGRHRLGLSYTAKVERPRYHDMRNSIEYISSFEYSSGNSELVSTTIRDMTLMYSWRRFRSVVSFVDKRNPIISVVERYGDRQALISRPLNVDHSRNLSLAMNWSGTAGIWYPYVNIFLNKPFLKINGASFGDPMLRLLMQNMFDLGNGFRGLANFSFSSAGHNSVYHYRTQGELLVGFSKSFKTDKWNLGLYWSDIFRTSRNRYVLDLGDIHIDNNSYIASKGLMFSVSYRFNTTESRYRGSEAGSDERGRL